MYTKEEIYSHWCEKGTKKTAIYFGVPEPTISYCVKKFNWTRPLEYCPNILKAVARGESHPWKYPRLEFEIPDDPLFFQESERIQLHAYRLWKKGTFIGWCLQHLDVSYCSDIYLWIKGNKKMDWVESYEDLIKAMKMTSSHNFEPRHFDKVKLVNEAYRNRE
ncbi:hypothetical protein [Gracilimonas sediminicola]|uniref:hypothetical protein n=1 Tax=Gracilimonas sediminicola TaxID=2952158 RepID=UPI0038D374E1